VHTRQHILTFCSKIALSLFFVWAWTFTAKAQQGISLGKSSQITVHGKVVDTRLQPIPFVSIFVKDHPEYMAQTNDTGAFALTFPEGRYELVAQLSGYKSNSAVVFAEKEDVYNVRILLTRDERSLSELKVSATKKDKSEEIVRRLIDRKEELMAPVKSYNVTMYIKASIENDDSFKVGRMAASKLSDSARAADSVKYYANKIGRNSLTEIVSNLDVQMPNKFKETRVGVKKNGSTSSLFYLRATDGDFNFYKNLVNVPSLSEVSFLSPLSYSGLVAYKYKMVSITEVNGRTTYRIKVTPTKMSNSLVQGEIFIEDSTYALRKCRLTFPSHQTPEYKTFTIEQEFDNYGNDEKAIWLLKQQSFEYTTVENPKNKCQTTVVYKNYVLDTIFPPKHFGEELSSTAAEAYERDSTFWNKERAVPLSANEVKLIAYKDSIYAATHSQSYYDSVDKQRNKITWGRAIWGGIENYKRATERTVTISPLLSYIEPFALGGPRLATRNSYTRRFKNYHRINIFGNVSYGYNNNDVLGGLDGSYRFNAFKQSYIGASIGYRNGTLVQNDAAINYLTRSVYFRNKAFSVYGGTEIVNGLYVSGKAEVSNRSSLENYKLFSSVLDSALADLGIPLLGGRNQPLPFDAYNVVYGTFTIRYIHKQKYIREPRQKIVLGSRYPTISMNYRKGIKGVLGSVIDFDYIEFELFKEQNLGTLGISKFTATYGSFLRRKRLEVADYRWVARGQYLIFTNPEASFQGLDSTMAINKGYLEAHYIHNFNGALVNKIPYAKKLKLFESAGGGLLIMPERNLRYVEFYAGIDKQFGFLGRQWRVGGYAVSSFANRFANPLQFKFGIKTYDIFSNTWQ
jgi:hypothetical protein